MVSFMQVAYDQAVIAYKKKEVPIGAVSIVDNKIISASYNQKEITNDPTAHAEMIVIRDTAKKLKSWRLTDVTLYVTTEPCIMCVGAMFHARISTLVYGCDEPRWGAINSLYKITRDTRLNHRIEVIPKIMEKECRELLQKFFKELRKK